MEWDVKSERSHSSSRGSVLTADSSRGSSYYQLSQNSSSVVRLTGDGHLAEYDLDVGSVEDLTERHDDVVLASSSNSKSDGESDLDDGYNDGNSRLYAYDDSLDAGIEGYDNDVSGRYSYEEGRFYSRHDPELSTLGDSMRSTGSASNRSGYSDLSRSTNTSSSHNDGRTSELITGSELDIATRPQYPAPAHQKRESALRHQKAQYGSQHKSGQSRMKGQTSEHLSPHATHLTSSSSASLTSSLRARAAQLDPLEAAVDIFDSATTLANDGFIDDAVPLYLHALKIFENYEYDELPLIREEIWKWVSIAETTAMTGEIEHIITAANAKTRSDNRINSPHQVKDTERYRSPHLQQQPIRSANHSSNRPKSEIDRLVSEVKRNKQLKTHLKQQSPPSYYEQEAAGTLEPIMSVHELHQSPPSSRTQRRSTSSPDVQPNLSRPVVGQSRHHSSKHRRHEHHGSEERYGDSNDEEGGGHESNEGERELQSRTQRRSTSSPDVQPTNVSVRRGPLKHQLSKQLQEVRRSLHHVEGAPVLPPVVVKYDDDELEHEEDGSNEGSSVDCSHDDESSAEEVVRVGHH